ncbi:MAG: translesion error-prone DNA polymerase V autoproteolytic subunit [Nitrospiraceae bacterium]|nr:translesion error-prone DNA polymerase V autoproteolytic subunit [Nitrospiraceae bacterium]MDW7653768.1 translesion error-prone DNA polymerase V autoproteolytic subunit [Nitrospiraceae bacterium]
MPMNVEAVYAPDLSTRYALPVFLGRLPAGFPSPADDYIEGTLDLNRHLIKHPAATFFVRVTGDSMIEAGIHSGDLLVVDRSLDAVDGNVIVAALDGELTVKRLFRQGDILRLLPANTAYQPIEILTQQSFEIFGVVTNVIHSL